MSPCTTYTPPPPYVTLHHLHTTSSLCHPAPLTHHLLPMSPCTTNTHLLPMSPCTTNTHLLPPYVTLHYLLPMSPCTTHTHHLPMSPTPTSCCMSPAPLTHLCHPAGDTTALPVHPVVPEAVRQVLDSGGMCGYSHSCGLDVARQAIAELYSPYTNDQNGINAKVSV